MRYLNELLDKDQIVTIREGGAYINEGCCTFSPGCRVNILALGDVGGSVLTGLRLLGEGTVSSIGIYDLSDNVLRRYEREVNQIVYPDLRPLPEVEIIDEEQLFNCQVFMFCATRGVPPVSRSGIGASEDDVRLAQLESNRELVSYYASKAALRGFGGIFAVVSDPVDQLCMAAVRAGIDKNRVRGFGLGVMNGRAAYYARKEERFSSYIKEGRAFGSHGKGLVIANSIMDYDDELSRELTELALNSNMETRRDGFKPYIAPAMSSAAISIIEMIRGDWHYSSVYFGNDEGGAFIGCKNRRAGTYSKIEDLPLAEELFDRIKETYEYLYEER